jgi:hypothetical protein
LFRFEEVGGVPVLITAMNQNTHSAKVQRQCSWALLTLSGSDGIAKLISQLDGDLAVMKAMTLHKCVNQIILFE